ncbi:hypothetical protein TVAG_427080 [Trichomonas vaginalis G3]|uniref:Uncharacterized protein n=1 Tax=Trichomonas vaginalis (strain ATCC PRA-98 / G3) TaxID=412133 RepID=A2FNP1_TRIV3|nr:hypothetical protein TVAGG3_0417120 [Trichomonas vaginalis G3]EAX93480.1 hypothetical protein TVAG_427080 [Trichomonas vaginalis G3]KAI5535779.1 hypothetical protein TVAGG3_0417120 [Trichomonas vaginalis G3]|eukprot:XP_001306410.1 hypothetical protein [Trichomonas vaginalis G3]
MSSSSSSPIKKKKGVSRPSLVILSTVDQPTPYQLKKFTLKEHTPNFFSLQTVGNDIRNRDIQLFNDEEPLPENFSSLNPENSKSDKNTPNSPNKNGSSGLIQLEDDDSSDGINSPIQSPKSSPAKSKILVFSKKSPQKDQNYDSEDEYSDDSDENNSNKNSSSQIKPPPLMQNVPKFEKRNKNGESAKKNTKQTSFKDINSFLANLDRITREFANDSLQQGDNKLENYIWLSTIWAYGFGDENYKKLNEVLNIIATNPDDLEKYSFGNLCRASYDLKNMGIESNGEPIIQSNYAIKGDHCSGKSTYIADSSLQYLIYSAAAQDYERLFVVTFDFSSMDENTDMWTLYHYIVERSLNAIGCQVPEISLNLSSLRKAFCQIADRVPPKINIKPNTSEDIKVCLKKAHDFITELYQLSESNETEFMHRVVRIPLFLSEIFNFNRVFAVVDDLNNMNFDLHLDNDYENAINLFIEFLNEVEYICCSKSGEIFDFLTNLKKIVRIDSNVKRIKNYDSKDIFNVLRSPGDLGSTAPSVATSAFSVLADPTTMKNRFINHLDTNNVSFAENFYDVCDDHSKRKLSRVARLQSAHKQNWLTNVWRLYDNSNITDESLISLFKYHAHADYSIDPLDGGLIQSAKDTLRKFMRSEGGISFYVKTVITGPPKSGKSTFIKTVLMRHFTDLITTGVFKSTFIVTYDIKRIPNSPTVSDLYHFFANSTISALQVQRADIGPYFPSIVKAFDNIESGARPKLPKPLTTQNYMRRPLKDLESLLCELYDSHKSNKVKFLQISVELPQRISDIFQFSNTLMICDHLDFSDFEIQCYEEDSKTKVNILSLIKSLISRTQFVASMDSNSCHNMLSPLNGNDTDLSHSCEIVNIAGMCQASTPSDILVHLSDGKSFKITKEHTGGYPAYVWMFEDAIKEISSVQELNGVHQEIGQKKLSAIINNLIKSMFEMQEDQKLDIQNCSLIMTN